MTLPLKFTTCCPHLTHINFAQNRITQIPKDVFNSLRQLIELQLQDNEISSIADGAFSDLRNLMWLSLEHNKLHALPRNIFKNLPDLEELTIQYNNLGNKEQYLFPPDAQVEFYPQSAPSLKMLVAQKIAESFERKNLLEVYKTLQTIPAELHADILAGASKKVALKIHEANIIQWLFELIAKSSVSTHKNLLELQSRDVQEVMLALAPEELRAQLIQIGFGSALPTGTRGPRGFLRRLAPAEQEESEEEFELMEEPN